MKAIQQQAFAEKKNQLAKSIKIERRLCKVFFYAAEMSDYSVAKGRKSK